MSKQYLQTHTLPSAHSADIFSIAVTPSHLITASGTASLKIYNARTGAAIHADSPAEEDPFPLQQTLEKAHPLGCHHVTAAAEAGIAASAGFGGELKVWECGENMTWSERACIVGTTHLLLGISKRH